MLWDESGASISAKTQYTVSNVSIKNSYQNTQGVRRSKSQTQTEQIWFSENRTSLLFFRVSSFSDLFMDVPPYLDANNIWKYWCEFLQRDTDEE